jgi:hypothetical protein
MAPGTIFGLVLIGVGVLYFLVAPVLTEAAVKMRSQSFIHASTFDQEKFRRENVRGARRIGILFVVLGMAAAVFGVVTGR